MTSDVSDPQIDRWVEHSRTYRADWTGRGQGVATDGQSWFVTSNDHNPGLFRYSADFATEEAHVDIPRSVAGHVGAVSIHDGTVYVALEGPEMIASFSRDLTDRSLVPIDRIVEQDDKRHLAWCAINPLNGLLYTCDWNHADTLSAYEPATATPRPDADIALDESVHRCQGGVFSVNGRVYLASDDKLSFRQTFSRWLGPLGQPSDEPIFPGIHGFDASGRKLGYLRIPTRPHLPHFEEIEGIGLGPMPIGSTVAHVHVALLDKNHSWARDDVHVRSYTVPAPDDL